LIGFVVSGDCVPYGLRPGVTAAQTFGSLIAARRNTTFLMLAYYYGTVTRRPHTGDDTSLGTAINPNTGLRNNVADQFDYAMSFDPSRWLDMSGEASVFHMGGASGPNAEPPEAYRAGLIQLCQRWAAAGRDPARMVFMDIVPQVLLEDATGETYYRTEVPQYNAIRHEVAKLQGASVILAHDHMVTAMYSMADKGASFFDPTGTTEPYNHWHNHLQAAGHAFIDALLTRPQYNHLFVMPTSVLNPPSSDGWTVAASSTHDGSASGWSGYTCRTVMPVTAGGTQVRVTLNAGASEGLNVYSAYVGKVSGTCGFVSPAQLSFSGSNTANIPAGGSAQGTANLTVAAGDSLVVSFYMNDANDTASRRMAPQSGCSAYYKVGNDAGTAAATGYTTSSSSVDGVTKIEVKP